MSEQIFRDPPSVELLQWLARGSLKQNLVRSVRLWVWLRLLYGEATVRVELNGAFTYAQWRDVFFSPTHPKGEEIPRHSDVNCLCNKSAAEWLFKDIEESRWRQEILQHSGIEEQILSEWLKKPLFALTRRMLCGDLHTLTELHWLEYHHRQYYRVATYPTRPTASSELQDTNLAADQLNFLPPDLAAIASNFFQEINGIQRFFFHAEYVIPKATIDRVDDYQEKLKQIWSQSSVPPILLVYNSAKLDREVECVVYPVCIYYVQRATYLCCFGQSPHGEINWCNYRLDRIQKLVDLSWTDKRIPQLLLQLYQQKHLPKPEYIQEEMVKVWGFDFYKKESQMLLRFDSIHDQRYIRGTVRHETFERVSYEQALRLIKQLNNSEERKILLAILQNRSGSDGYYTALYREDDPNILMRIQAWRPFAEVILPIKLRQRMAADVEKEWKLYH